MIGLITYMRTDSVAHLRRRARRSATLYRQRNTAPISFPKSRTSISVKKSAQAQEAHEAIRPTSTATTIPRRSRTISPERSTTSTR